MKDSLDNKEIIKICGMNNGPVAWLLSSSPNNTFKELFKKVIVYEELQCVAVVNIVNKTSVNAKRDYIPQENMKKCNNKFCDGRKPQQWQDQDIVFILIILKDGLMYY